MEPLGALITFETATEDHEIHEYRFRL